MTSWDWTSLLLLVLFNIDLSEQGCIDYLNREGMGKIDLLDLVPLIKAKDDNSTNAIICTLKNECQSKDENPCCNLLKYCIYMDDDKDNLSDNSECEGKSGLNISLYHLRCLTAEIFLSMTKGEYGDDTYEGCKYDNVCQLYSDITPHAQTTTRPPPSTASESAPTAPSSLSPETTPTAPGTLTQKATTTVPRTLLPKVSPTVPRILLPKATPTAPCTLSPKATPTAPRAEQKTTPAPRTEQKTTTAPRTEQKTATTAPTTLLREGDKALTIRERIGESNLMNLLFMSLTFNVVGPLLVYLYMRLRTQNQTPVVSGGPWEEVALTNMQFQNMHSGTRPESVQLMQLTESASNITSIADPAQDGFTGRLPS